jgi:phenylalanyl-tRNA synthetase alpha chain
LLKDLNKHKNLEEIYNQAMAEIVTATLKDLDDIRVKYLGRKGKLTTILRSLGTLPVQERPVVGKLANQVRQAIEESLEKKLAEERAHTEAGLREESVDLTLPGRQVRLGRKHIITQVIDEIIQIFIGLGYNMVEGPEIETDYYNFTALNTPPDHPARTLQATFYVEAGSAEEEILLRTHTSPVQIRVMEQTKPPIYVIAPGRVYRPDVPDPSHSPMFHQVEGFAVDKRITFGDLKGTLEAFARRMFGSERRVRFRPHYFPFTEPSAEVDVSCIVCGGEGCRVCSYTGWLEILGAGMIDPNVFKEVNYDPEKVTGFAFGMAPDRIAMLKYGIPDIRMFFENDLRFLKQF